MTVGVASPIAAGASPALAPAVDVVGFLQQPIILAFLVFVAFLIAGFAIGQLNKRLMVAVGVPATVEGTAFERTARGLGTSTVAVIARLSSWFVYGVGALFALYVSGVLDPGEFWAGVARLFPRVFVAVLVLIVGVVAGDKLELLINERLRSVKLPEISVVGTVAKYTLIYVAILIALAQVGVATGALLVLLAVYFFGIVFLLGIACRHLLSSGAAGIYLLLTQPYGIGDTVRIGDRRGIVQEVDLLVTRVENDGEEYIIPNRTVFEEGAVRQRS